MWPLLLYVHGSADMYGSDKVLFNLATASNGHGRMKPVVVLHEDGPLRAALAQAGVEVHVATVAKISRAMFTVGAPLVLWRQLHQAACDLDRVVGGRQVAVVYSNTLAVLGGAFWAWRRRLRHVWHVHEIILQPALVHRGLPLLVSMLADRVICNSFQTQAWLLGQVPRLAARSTVIFNGIAPVREASAAEVDRFRSRIGAAAEDVVVTVAGRLNHMKGQGLLIEAAAMLRDDGRLGRILVVVVGDVYAGHADFRSRLVEQARDRGIGERVRFVPFVPEIETVWKASDIAVVPSLDPESFGMVAIEAMACALPVIAAAHGGILDIVKHEETGLLFRPRDPNALAGELARLAADPDLRHRLGAAGAARQRELFSLQRQIEFTQKVCEDLGAE